MQPALGWDIAIMWSTISPLGTIYLFCNTLWHIICTLNTSQLKATMKLKIFYLSFNLISSFFLYILHSSFLAPPVIDQLLGVSCAAESSMRQQWEDLRQWLCPGKGETFKYHFHFSKPKKLLDICKHDSFVWAKVMLFKTTQRQFMLHYFERKLFEAS